MCLEHLRVIKYVVEARRAIWLGDDVSYSEMWYSFGKNYPEHLPIQPLPSSWPAQDRRYQARPAGVEIPGQLASWGGVKLERAGGKKLGSRQMGQEPGEGEGHGHS